MPLRRLFPLVLVPILMLTTGFRQVESNKPLPPPLQPEGERAAQAKLPQSTNPLWAKLAQCDIHYDQRTALYSVSIIPDVKALNGKTVTANGFVLPLDGQDKTRHFLLTKRTPVCFFCPPGAPNEVIEVKSKQAIDWTDALVSVRGRFELIDNGAKAVFFALDDAEKIP